MDLNFVTSLYGKEKNNIMPEVTLLRMDQMAKRAIPITAKTEDTISVISFNSAPNTKASIIKSYN